MHLNVFMITFVAWTSLFICSQDVYAWERDGIEKEIGYTVDDVSEDITMKHEKASQFLERTRRGLNHECYAECCSWEEVRDHYEHDIPAAEKYWNTFKRWGYRNRRCLHKFNGR